MHVCDDADVTNKAIETIGIKRETCHKGTLIRRITADVSVELLRHEWFNRKSDAVFRNDKMKLNYIWLYHLNKTSAVSKYFCQSIDVQLKYFGIISRDILHSVCKDVNTCI